MDQGSQRGAMIAIFASLWFRLRENDSVSVMILLGRGLGDFFEEKRFCDPLCRHLAAVWRPRCGPREGDFSKKFFYH